MLTSMLLLPLLAGLGLVSALEPAAIYDGGYNETQGNVTIRVGTGGAGQSGILKALADQFIVDRVTKGWKPFRISWYTSDTFGTINYLQEGVVDVGITYNEVSEEIAMAQGIAQRPSYYAWRDHFILVGPQSNPAELEINATDVDKAFSNLFVAAEKTKANNTVRFLSRNDKSATNVKEALRWAAIGQTPWALPYSTWYHQYVAFPIGALTAAIQLGEYTVTDFGTYLSLPPKLTQELEFYTAMSDNVTHPLLNPAHMLVSKTPQNETIALDFAKWITQKQGGQKVIREFAKNGYVLYTEAPEPPESVESERSGLLTQGVQLDL